MLSSMANVVWKMMGCQSRCRCAEVEKKRPEPNGEKLEGAGVEKSIKTYVSAAKTADLSLLVR